MTAATNKLRYASMQPNPDKILKMSSLETKLGSMVAIADETSLYLLEFADYRGLNRAIERLQQKTKSTLLPGTFDPMRSIESELSQYLEGELKEFKTPLSFWGSPFQNSVWEELRYIPFGETRSYADIAARIGNPLAFRAVANANGANHFVIIVPCHRVINTNGSLGGYGRGIARKKWLLKHENKLSPF